MLLLKIRRKSKVYKHYNEKWRMKEKILKKYLAIIVIVFLSVIVLWALGPFINALFGGLILGAILVKPHEYLTKKLKLGRNVSSLLVMLLSFIVIIIPLFSILFIVGGEIQNVVQNPDQINSLVESTDSLFPQIDLQTKIKEKLPEVGSIIVKFIVGFLSKTGDIIFTLFMMYFLVFFFLATPKEVRRKHIYSIVPFSKKNTIKLIEKFGAISNSALKTTGIIALAQGALLTILFLVLGIPGAFTWGFIGAILSFIPAVGVVLIWVPFAIFMFATGEINTGVFLTIGGIIISTVDNIMRPLLSERGAAKMHPFTALLGVFMGISAFGIIGIIVGPLLLTFLFMTVKMFKEEYVR